MEIIERSKGNSGEIVGFSENPETVREEVDRRARKAGYFTRRTNISAGWSRQYEENFNRIFRKDK